MVNLRPILGSILMLLTAPLTVGAGPIEDRVQHHLEMAIEDGVEPIDFHHLVFAFSWNGTLEDWTIARRSLDRLAGARPVDALMVDEIRAIRAQLEVDSGRDAAARELFRTMGGLTAWWFRDPQPLEELADFDGVAVAPDGHSAAIDDLPFGVHGDDRPASDQDVCHCLVFLSVRLSCADVL